MITRADFRVGWFLATRQIRRANLWTTSLIVFVMVLTFLELVVVTGLMVGIVQGISDQYRRYETGDVLISNLDSKDYIAESPQIISFIRSVPQVKGVSVRYVTGGTIEANYKTRSDTNEKPNRTSAQIAGIDPIAEDAFSGLGSMMGEGRYLQTLDYDQVIVGQQLIDRYSFGHVPGLNPLINVYPGTKVRVTVGGNTREMTVKGIIKSTANSPLAMRVFMNANELSVLMGRTDFNVNEIAVLLKNPDDRAAFRDLLLRSDIGDKAKVQTFEDSIPNGVQEVKNTFEMLGNAFSSAGLIVAAILIFIIIFVNALTRRKYIGILKGIGITGAAIEIAYMIQSLFYALLGSAIGLAFLYGFLVPYVNVHPIQLPISNAIITAPFDGTVIRVALLSAATLIAGYIPARMIVRKNTLDSILGRN